MAWYDQFIEKVPGVIGGEPVLKKTRISVLAVVEYYELYGSLPKVIEVFPEVPQEHLEAALAYYRDHQTEIERYRREDAQSDSETESISDLYRRSA
jgi:uncharacterized protein (DUF433 family)